MRCRGNHQIEILYQSSFLAQLRFDVAKSAGDFRVNPEDGERADEIVNGLMIRVRTRGATYRNATRPA